MRIHRRQLLTAAGFLTLGGCGSDPGFAPAAAQVPPAPQPSLLFVLAADGGSLAGNLAEGANPPLASLLTLQPVGAQVTVFEDRPGRTASRQSTAELVNRWSEYGFARFPPNAVVTVGAGLSASNHALVLADPIYRPEVGALSFVVTPDLGDSGAPLPARFGPSTVYLDATNSVSASSSSLPEFQLSLQAIGSTSPVSVTIAGQGGGAVFSLAGVPSSVITLQDGNPLLCIVVIDATTVAIVLRATGLVGYATNLGESGVLSSTPTTLLTP